ncbi:MAG: VIT1/CCC1 transporter family protein [Spirochaetota bacterium]
MQKHLTPETILMIIKFQKSELTEYHIYNLLASHIKNHHNARILKKVAEDERKHYEFWKSYTHSDVKPDRWKIIKYYIISRLFGLTFGVKLMERGEEQAQASYKSLESIIPEVKKIIKDEHAHEKELYILLEEEHLQYVGSVVLGLNDALVELTGTLAGLSFALANTRLIALAGLITGVAAALSMAASEYLSSKAEEAKDALKSAIYTGIAYIITVLLLIIPYFVAGHYLVALCITLTIALLIIFLFNYYIAIAKDLNFKKRFSEMAIISLGVAGISFAIGFFIKKYIGIDV